MAKLRRDVRALSPIFAVLLLIAIAVIAGIIIYMYTSGYLATMMGGGTAGQEKVAIEAVVVVDLGGASTNSSITAYAQSTGGGPVVITGAILRDAEGKALETEPVAATTLNPGVLTAITCEFTTPLTSGNTYTVAFVSFAGNQFVSSAFKA